MTLLIKLSRSLKYCSKLLLKCILFGDFIMELPFYTFQNKSPATLMVWRKHFESNLKSPERFFTVFIHTQMLVHPTMLQTIVSFTCFLRILLKFVGSWPFWNSFQQYQWVKIMNDHVWFRSARQNNRNQLPSIFIGTSWKLGAAITIKGWKNMLKKYTAWSPKADSGTLQYLRWSIFWQ